MMKIRWAWRKQDIEKTELEVNERHDEQKTIGKEREGERKRTRRESPLQLKRLKTKTAACSQSNQDNNASTSPEWRWSGSGAWKQEDRLSSLQPYQPLDNVTTMERCLQLALLFHPPFYTYFAYHPLRLGVRRVFPFSFFNRLHAHWFANTSLVCEGCRLLNLLMLLVHTPINISSKYTSADFFRLL